MRHTPEAAYDTLYQAPSYAPADRDANDPTVDDRTADGCACTAAHKERHSSHRAIHRGTHRCHHCTHSCYCRRCHGSRIHGHFDKDADGSEPFCLSLTLVTGRAMTFSSSAGATQVPPCAMAPIEPHSRILFKLSGEWLKGSSPHIICTQRLEVIANSIKELRHFHWGIVLGGGNLWRKRDTDHPAMMAMSDDMGMMGTHINGLALCSALAYAGVEAALFTARPVDGVGHSFSKQGVLDAWSQQKVSILTGGLGHGGVSTDTTAVIRAYELECDIVLKGTKVNGVYTSDPMVNQDAQFLPHVTYTDALAHRLGFMDESALILARQHRLRLHIISLQDPQALTQWVAGRLISSSVTV